MNCWLFVNTWLTLTILLLQALDRLGVECAIHHERDVGEEYSTYS